MKRYLAWFCAPLVLGTALAGAAQAEPEEQDAATGAAWLRHEFRALEASEATAINTTLFIGRRERPKAGFDPCAGLENVARLVGPGTPGVNLHRTPGRLPGNGLFTFTLTKRSTLVATARSASFDTILELYDSTGARLARDDDGGGGTDSFITMNDPLPTGDYCLKVEGYGGSEGEFTLVISDIYAASDVRTAPLWSTESGPCKHPGLTSDIGGPLFRGFGSRSTNQRTSGGERFFDLLTAEPLRLRITAKSRAFDTALNLYDSNGDQIRSNDDGPDMGTDSAILTDLALPAGRYCIGVQAFEAQGADRSASTFPK